MFELTCLLSAVLFVVSNLLGFSLFHRFRQHHGGGSVGDDGDHSFWEDFKRLDPEWIREQWRYRRETYYLELVAGIMNAVAWMIFCLPLLQMAWIQQRQSSSSSHGGGETTSSSLGVHVAVAALALGGSVTELIARLMFVGAASTSHWLAKDFNLDAWIDTADGDATQGDMIGWRVLEMVHLITRGLLLWIDAAEWLFLSAIFILIYVSVMRTESSPLSRKWACLGLLIGLLAFVDFSSEVLRLKSWRTFSFASLFISYFTRLLFMPIWLLWLGRQLLRVRMEDAGKGAAATAEERVQEMVQYGNNNEEEDEHEGAVYS